MSSTYTHSPSNCTNLHSTLKPETVCVCAHVLPSEPWPAPPSVSHILSLELPSLRGSAAATGCRSKRCTPLRLRQTGSCPQQNLPPGLAHCNTENYRIIADDKKVKSQKEHAGAESLKSISLPSIVAVPWSRVNWLRWELVGS